MRELRRFIAAITFPGVVFHEFGHKFFCDITGVKVTKICYFRFGNPAGYVIHLRPKKFIQSFLIAVGPLITGTLFALAFFYIAENQVVASWHRISLIWLGISVAMHSFPSDNDAKSLWQDTNRHIVSNLFAIIGYPFAILIWLANSLTIIWFDLFYSLLLYHSINPLF